MHLLAGGLKGIEKESLRLAKDGTLAQTPHPLKLGSTLTHAWITTDYSEALIELITPPKLNSSESLGFLEDLHRFVYSHLDDELLLATSMPIPLHGDDNIPIACYGSSNIGKMKHVYRRGLAYRYGKSMQAIAGIHFNYSVNTDLWPILHELEGGGGAVSDFIADAYFGLIRNVHRFGWLLIYLFGCSPAVYKTFIRRSETIDAGFTDFDAKTFYRPNATSLRMSDIGYRNDSQGDLDISFNNLKEYIANLSGAITQPFTPYEKIGVKVDGEYRQLNANILQIENEYYSSIRPKQVANSGEKPSLALQKRGVRYVELRTQDLDCYQPAGIGIEQMRFLEVFILLCLLEKSPTFDAREKSETSINSLRVACCGRASDFQLKRHGDSVLLREWALELLDRMIPIAEVLDRREGSGLYTKSLELVRPSVTEPGLTPSARMLLEMRERRESFEDFALRLSHEHAAYWRASRLDAAKAMEFDREALDSIAKQAEIEASDVLSFDDFLARYFSQT